MLATPFHRLCRYSIRFRLFNTTAKEIYLDRLENGVVSLVLNKESAKNSLSLATLQSLQTLIDEAHNDSSIRVLILRSTLAKIFCVGADLKERMSLKAEDIPAFVSRIRNTFTKLDNLAMPTIASIDGFALGGGLEMALACDMRIVSSSATLGLPEVGIAVIPGAGGTQRLPRLLGISKASELIYTARKMSGKEAVSFGLVNECVETNSSYDRSIAIANEIAKNGPLAVRAAKKAMKLGMQQSSLSEALAIEESCYNSIVPTKDRIEGLKAFLEKRSPKYSNE